MSRLKRWAYRLAMLALVSLFAMALAYSFPADLALLFAADLAAYAEAVFTVYVMARIASAGPALAALRQWIAAQCHRVRGRTAPRPRPIRSERKADNDDEPDAAWRRAA